MAPQTSVRALLLLNPNSRQGTEARLQVGVQRLREAGIEVEQLESISPEASRRAVEDRCREIDLVILGGGDGTISAMAATLVNCQLAFAVLPLGTANDLARSLGVADSLGQAFDAIIANHRRRIDLGCLNGHYFFNAAQIGLGPKVTEELTDEVKKRWGVLGYLKALFAALSRSDRFRADITVDGRHHRVNSMHLAVGNGRFYGGGNVISQDAYIDDGLLSLYSLQPQTLWTLLLLAPLLRTGSQQQHRRIFTAQGGVIDINTRRRMAVHADGEPSSHTPARIQICPGALVAIMGPSADRRH